VVAAVSAAVFSHAAATAILLSLPAALITKAYAPILIIDAIGGVIIAGIIQGWRSIMLQGKRPAREHFSEFASSEPDGHLGG
jgi:hypothetical protein